MTVAIELREVFRVHRGPEGDAAALQGLTLSVAEGETVVIAGPSGSGKSTLLRVICGLEEPSAGSVRVLGRELARASVGARAALRQASIGLVDQHADRALPAALSCRDVVGLPLALRGVARGVRHRRADELLERVGLADRAGVRPHVLSGGERQRLAVCAAVAHRPALLLADEPGGELDAASAHAVYALIAALARHEGTTVLLVSHDRAASAVADRTLRLRDGRISAQVQADGADRLVVGRGGWVRLPEALLADAGLADSALDVRAEWGALELRGRPDEPAAERDAALPREAGAEGERGAVGPAADVVGPARDERPARDGRSVTDVVVAELRGVAKRYGDRLVLDAFDAEFRSGRLTVVAGRSGSGKTTILRLLAGLERPDAGDVVVGGVDLATLDRAGLAHLRATKVGVVAQEVGLVSFLTARENVALALGATDAKVEEWLDRVGLAERSAQRVDRLSGGERQRVAVARALVNQPQILLVDEPTSRLDEANAQAVATLLKHVANAHGTAIICATHDAQMIDRADATIGGL
jgi:energy-coupling factor transport system ATP-binding protein